MCTTFSKTQARRRLRRLLSLVGKGHTFVITKRQSGLLARRR